MLVLFEIKFAKSCYKSLKKIPSPWRNKIFKAIDVLESDPYLGEKMQGKLSDQRKIRIWPYRILYSIDKSKRMLHILKIDHRGSIGYK